MSLGRRGCVGLLLALAACAQDPGKVPGCRTAADCTGGEVCIARTGVCERFNRPLDIDATLRDAVRIDASIRMDGPRRDAARADAPATDAPSRDGGPVDAARTDARSRG